MPDNQSNLPPKPASRMSDGDAGLAADATDTEVSEPVPAEAAGTSLADTTGTGTIVALGCIGATLFLIVLGLLYLGLTQLFG